MLAFSERLMDRQGRVWSCRCNPETLDEQQNQGIVTARPRMKMVGSHTWLLSISLSFSTSW